MPISTLADFFTLDTDSLSLNNTTISFDRANNIMRITGTTTVLGNENQSVTIHISSDKSTLVVDPQVTLTSMTLQQLASLGVLPTSIYQDQDLPTISFTDVRIIPDQRTRLLTFRGNGPHGSLPLGVTHLPVTNTALYLEVSVNPDNKATNRQAYIDGTLAIGAGSSVQVLLPRGATDWQLQSLAPTSLTGGLANLTELTETTISSLLPGVLPGIQTFELSKIMVQFNTLKARMHAVQCIIASTNTWKLLPDVLQVTGFQLNLSFTRWSDSLAVAGNIEGEIQIFDLPISISIPIPLSSDIWYMTAYPNVTIPGLGDLVTALGHLIGTDDLSTSLPPGLDTFASLLIQQIEIGFQPIQQTAAQILKSVAFRVQAASDWIIPYAPNLKLSNAYLNLLITHPLDQNRLVTGILGGTISLGSVSIPIQIERPTAASDWVLRILYSDISVSLPDLLTLAGVNPTDFRHALPRNLSIVSDLALTDLEVDYNLTTNKLASVAFSMGLADIWTIIPDYLLAQEIDFSSSYIWQEDRKQWEFLLYLQALIEIAAVRFIFTANNANAWILTASMVQGDTISLTRLLNWLVQKLLAADFRLPSGFPEVIATGAEVRITPATNAFYAKLVSTITWDISFAQAALKIQDLTTILDIGAISTSTTRPYSFTASGKFLWQSITGEATFTTSSLNAPTIIRVELEKTNQISLPNLVNGLLDSGQSSTWDSMPVPTDYPRPSFMLKAGLIINLTDNRFLAYGNFTLPDGGEKADMYAGVAILVARQAEGNEYAYAIAAKLQNWSFARISSVLGAIEQFLSVKQTSAVILLSQLEGQDVSALSTYIPDIGTSIDTKRGLNFSAQLEFSSGLLSQIAQLAGITTQGPFTLKGYIPNDASQSEFQAKLGNLTLLGFLSFKEITLLYQVQQTSTFLLNGQIVVHVDQDYLFRGNITVKNTTENNVSVTRAIAHIDSTQVIEQPLGIPHLRFSSLFFDLYQVFGGGQSDTQFALGGSVTFTKAVNLNGFIYFKQATPVVTVIQVGTLSIDDLFSAVIDTSWPTGFLNLILRNGMLYYAPKDVSLVRYNRTTNTTETIPFQAGFHASTDIDIFFIKDFHIEASILGNGIIISGGYQTPIDWGFITFYRGPSINPEKPSDPTRGPVVSVNSTTNTFNLSGGLALFGTNIASLSINVQRQLMAGSLAIEQNVGPFGKPRFDFVWDESGFRVTNWPLGKIKLPDFDFDNLKVSGHCPASGIVKIPIQSKVKITPSFSIVLEPVLPDNEKKPFLNITLTGSIDLVINSSAYPDALLSAPIGKAILKVPCPATGTFTWDMLAASFIDCIKGAASSIFDTLIKDPRNLAKLLAVKGIEWSTQAVKDFLICQGASAAEATAFIGGATSATPVIVGVLGVTGILIGGVVASKDDTGNHHNEGGGGDQSKPRPVKPTAPTLTYENEILTVKWNPIANASKYTVVIKQDDADFAQSQPSSSLSSSFQAPDGHRYSALVVATGDGGTSDPGDRATLTIPGHVTINSVIYENGQVVARWVPNAEVTNATQYSGQLMSDNRPLGPMVTVAAHVNGTPTLSIAIDPPSGNILSLISFQVKATITGTQPATSGNWSISQATLTKLSMPVISSLTHKERQVTIVLQKEYSGTGIYRAQFVNGEANEAFGKEFLSTDLTPSTVILDDSTLASGTYKIRVRASGQGNAVIPSDWSISTETIVTPGSILLKSLTYANNLVQASWSTSSTATSYDFELRGGSTPIATRVQKPQGQPLSPSLSLPIGSIIPRDIPYTGFMRANAGENTGAWSPGIAITLFDIPSVIAATYARNQINVSWKSVTGATAFELTLLDANQQPEINLPHIPATTDPIQRWSFPVATQAQGTYTLQIRSIAKTLLSAWSTSINVVVEPLTPEILAERLHDRELNAQDAARLLFFAFKSQFTNNAGAMITLIQRYFPESTKTPTQVARALAMVPYPATQTTAALHTIYQGKASLADILSAIKATYPAESVILQIRQLRFTDQMTASSAISLLRAAHKDLTALQMAILLLMYFEEQNPTQMAQLLQDGKYSVQEATGVLFELYPLSSTADIAAAIKSTYLKK